MAGYIAKAWTDKYSASGTASAAAIASVVSTTAGAVGGLKITMLDPGTAGYAVDVNVTVAAGTVTATNAKNLDYVIGATRLESDDATVDTDVVIHLTSVTAGTILNEVSGVTSNSTGTSLIELTTNKKTNETDPGAGTDQPSATRSGDAIIAEDGTPKVVTTAGQAKTRVHWL